MCVVASNLRSPEFGCITYAEVNTAFQFYVFLKLDNMKQALPIKHEKHFEKMAELIYAELTQGRESTRLPHTHKFTSLKNVVISAQHKIDKRIHIQAYMQFSKEEYARKRIHKGCLVQIESPVTQDNCSATVTVVTEFSISSSQPLNILIIK